MNSLTRHSKLLALPLLLALSSQAGAVAVTTELALVIDISNSVDQSEYDLQVQSYENAFNNPSIQNRIVNSPNGVAIAVFYFSTLPTATRVNMGDTDYAAWSAPILDWQLLTTAQDATNFAMAIGDIIRPTADPPTRKAIPTLVLA